MSRRVSAAGRESRRRILRATLALAAERGYDGTTIGLVSKRCGLAASSIYWHFENKDRLLAEAMEFGFHEWHESMTTVSAKLAGQPFEVAARERIRLAARAVQSRPDFWQLGLQLCLQSRPDAPSARQRFFVIHRQIVETLVAWWAQALPPELAGQEVAERLGRYHVLLIDGLYVAQAADRACDLPALAERLAAGLIATLRSRQGHLE